jgi:hypothetical protein
VDNSLLFRRVLQRIEGEKERIIQKLSFHKEKERIVIDVYFDAAFKNALCSKQEKSFLLLRTRARIFFI